MKTIFPGIACLLLLMACHPNTKQAPEGTPQTNAIRNVRTDTLSDKKVADTVQVVISSDQIIEPGKRLGKIYVGEAVETLAKTLGKPDYSDAAMGKAWLTWFGKKRDEHNNHTELNVYTTYKDSNMTTKVVKQIRTTSSWFTLKNNMHVYSDFSTIQEVFPDLKYLGKYKNENREIKVYDNVRDGIAFEVVTANKQQICTGIIVHLPGKSIAATYIPLHQSRVRE